MTMTLPAPGFVFALAARKSSNICPRRRGRAPRFQVSSHQSGNGEAAAGGSAKGGNAMRDGFDEMEHRNWELGYDAYDRGFGPLTRQAVPTLLERAGFPSEGDVRLVDVATGPGFVLSAAIDAAAEAKAGPGPFRLTGLDIAQNFLDLAEKRMDSQRKRRSKRIEVDFAKGGAESMPFPDGTFDAVVCNFGILHFFDPRSFLRESHRVLRPGGRVSFSAWAPPVRTEGFGIALESIAEAGNPDVDGIPEGPGFFDFGVPETALAAVKEAGFDDAKSEELTEMTWDNLRNGTMLYDILLEGTSRTREVLLGQTPEETAAVRSLMEEKYDRITCGGKRPLSMPVVVTSGRKPF